MHLRALAVDVSAIAGSASGLSNPRVVSNLLLTDDLQIQLLQLKSLRVTAENVYHAPAAERWAFFLKIADQLVHEDFNRLFPDQEFAEAAGVLEMISQTPQQQMFYDARLKFQRDEVARIRYAEQEGLEKAREEGEARGRKFGRITLMQDLLGIPTSQPEELAGYDDVKLYYNADQLQQQLRARSQ